MKKKRYLKTVEDVLAFKDTDTKIYAENESGYYQFVNGILCAFDDEGLWAIGHMVWLPDYSLRHTNSLKLCFVFKNPAWWLRW